MSEFYFAVHTGSVHSDRGGKIKGGKTAAAKRYRIAKKIDPTAGYVYYFDSARQEWRGWGYCRNMGHPFDQATARAIEAAWKAAGVGCGD